MERIKFGRLKTSLSQEQLYRKGIGNEELVTVYNSSTIIPSHWCH